MKIVADQDIPFLEHYFGAAGKLIVKPGRMISADDVNDAGILLVRSVTTVNEKLLAGSKIKFVGSVTAGHNHIDLEWLKKNDIQCMTAKGSNTKAVVEYVLCCVAALQKNNMLKKSGKIGVIGCGEIGSQIVAKFKLLGYETIIHDPIRARQEKNFISTPLAEFKNLDLITIHTPLSSSGTDSTFHLLKKNFLQQQQSGTVLLNTSRGDVIHFADLKKYGTHLVWCFDVWGNEPDIDLAILEKTFIATPHIAGYSQQSKWRGIKMIYDYTVQQKLLVDYHPTLPTFKQQTISVSPEMTWQDMLLSVFDPLSVTAEMKKTLLKNPKQFDDFRKTFVNRNEMNEIFFKNMTPVQMQTIEDLTSLP